MNECSHSMMVYEQIKWLEKKSVNEFEDYFKELGRN